MLSNIPSVPAYGVYASQLIRYARCCSNYSDFLLRHRTLVTREGNKVNRLSNTFKKFYGRHTDLADNTRKNVCQMFADSISSNDFYLMMDLLMTKLIKLANMAGVVHDSDHIYSIWSTW